MKKILSRTRPLMMAAGVLLAGGAIAQPAEDRRPSEANAQALAEMVRKHTRVEASTKSAPISLSSHLYSIVFGHIMMDPAERALIPADDLKTLDEMPGHRDRRFVESERAELGGLCAKLRNRGSLDISDLAQEFEEARDGHEEQLRQHYERVLGELKPATAQRIRSKLQSASAQLQFTETKLNLFDLSAEAPEMAELLLERGCIRYDAGLAREPLRNSTLREEMNNPERVVPINPVN